MRSIFMTSTIWLINGGFYLAKFYLIVRKVLIERQTDRQTGRQTDRQTVKHRDRRRDKRAKSWMKSVAHFVFPS